MILKAPEDIPAPFRAAKLKRGKKLFNFVVASEGKQQSPEINPATV